MGEVSYDVVDQAMPMARSPWVLPEGSRPSQLRHGHAVPFSELNVAELEIPRGGRLDASMVACAHCTAVYVLRWAPRTTFAAAARREGWTCSASSWGWLCAECTAQFGGES